MTTVAEAIQRITEANRVVQSNDDLFKNISQTVIAGVVVLGWALAVLAIYVWSFVNAAGADQFICNTPPATGATVGTDCTNGWIATKQQFQDVFTFAVLPFVTLVIGFYFGQKTSDGG